MPEGIDETCFQHSAEAIDFGLGVTGRFIVIGFRAGDVDFLMRDIEIAAGNQRFSAIELLKIGRQFFIPGLPVVEAHQFFTGIGNIDIKQNKIFEFGRDDATFLVVFVDADILQNLYWLLLG